MTLASIDGDLPQIPAERGGDHLAHADGGTRGGVDLVPVMGLDDLDVDLVPEHSGGDVQQLEAEIHPNAHIWGEDNPDILPRRGDPPSADPHRGP